MKVVQAFQTADGKMHTTRAAAKQHEAELDAVAKISAIMRVAASTGRVDSVAKGMLLEVDALIAVLQSYRRKLPKEEVAVMKEAA